MQKKGRSSQTIVQPWGRVLVPQGIYIIIYFWVLQELKPPARLRMEWWCWPSWLQSTKAWMLSTLAPILCWILLCSSPLHEYACALSLKLSQFWTSLVAQLLRISLPMQGTRVWTLVWEDPTCRGATKPVCHNYWACALEPVSHNSWTRVPQLLKPTHLEPVLRNKRSHSNEKPAHHNKE